jgi:tetratricopeptide (TPR) repeat protein
MKVRYLLSACAATAALSALLWGQAMTRIVGVVKGPDGAPVQGAEVMIRRTDIKAEYPVKTDKNGKFTYATLPKGVYDVTITFNGTKLHEEQSIYTDPIKDYTIEVDPAKKSGVQVRKFVGLPKSKLPALEAVRVATGPAAGAAAPGAPAGRAMTEAEIAAERERLDREKAEFEAAQGKIKGLQDAFAAGRQAAEGRNWDVAISAFTKAGEFDPKQDAVWANLADAYRQRADTKKGSERQADLVKAAENYTKALEIKPADASLFMDLSLVLARGGKMAEAEAALEKGIAIDKLQAGRGYRNLAAVHVDTGNSKAGEAAFRKAIELEPTNADAHFHLGTLLVSQATEEGGKLKAPPGTAEEFQQYLAIAPTGPYSADAKAMLDALGAPIVSRVTNQKDKGKGKGK